MSLIERGGSASLSRHHKVSIGAEAPQARAGQYPPGGCAGTREMLRFIALALSSGPQVTRSELPFPSLRPPGFHSLSVIRIVDVSFDVVDEALDLFDNPSHCMSKEADRWTD